MGRMLFFGNQFNLSILVFEPIKVNCFRHFYYLIRL
jgi:hypothetical protein